MKPTQSSTYRSLQAQLNKISTGLMKLNNIASTGKKVNKPSDNPSAVKAILHTRTRMLENDRFINTMELSLDKISAIESYMDQVENTMVRAKEITIGSVNAALNNEDLGIMADQIANLRDEMLTTANAQLDGKYIFAGYEEKTKPFTVVLNDGSTDPPGYTPYDPTAYDPAVNGTWPRVVYNGDENTSTVEVSPGEYLDVNLNGEELFLGDADHDKAVDAGATDIFATLTRLEAAMRLGDSTAVSAEIVELDNGADQARRLRSRLGNNASQLEHRKDNIRDSQVDLTKILSRYEDADILEIIGKINQQQAAFEAALSITARVSKLSIFNYL